MKIMALLTILLICMPSESDAQEGKLLARGELYDIRVSSVLPHEKDLYNPKNLFGANPAKAWCEGNPGDGIGEWVRIDFHGPKAARDVDSIKIKIAPGYAHSEALFKNNARPSQIRLSLVNTTTNKTIGSKDVYDVTLEDKPQVQVYTIPIGQRIDSSELRIELKIGKVAKGSKYSDMCISEISVVVHEKKKKILDMNAEELQMLQAREAKEVALLKKALPSALRGDQAAIQSVLRLASGEYINGAEGGEWLNEVYLELLMKQAAIFLSLLERQEDEVRARVQEELLQPVTDVYSNKQLAGAVSRARSKGIAASTAEKLMKAYSEK